MTEPATSPNSPLLERIDQEIADRESSPRDYAEEVTDVWKEARTAIATLTAERDEARARAENQAALDNSIILELKRDEAKAWAATRVAESTRDAALAEVAVLRLHLTALTKAVGAMKVPQNTAEAAMQVTLTIGPVYEAAVAVLAPKGAETLYFSRGRYLTLE